MKCSLTLRFSRLFWIFTCGTTTFCYACTTETWRDRSDVIKYSIITEKRSNKFIPTYSLLRLNDSLIDIPENDILRYNVIRSSDRPSDWRRTRRAGDSKAHQTPQIEKQKKSTTNLKSDQLEKATTIIISSSVLISALVSKQRTKTIQNSLNI